MEVIPNAPYYRLLSYIDRCVRAATSITAVHSLPSTPCASSTKQGSKRAFRKQIFMDAIPEVLQHVIGGLTTAVKDRPLGSSIAITSSVVQAFLVKLASFQCYCSSNERVPSKCSEAGRLSWGFAFLKQYGDAVDDAVSKVK